MRCDLAPGVKLVIDTLSQELEVSPIPIRAALQRLEAEGLVEIIPHTGAIVSEISPNLVTEIFMLLEALESVAFETAVAKATDDDIARLQQLVDTMDQQVETGDADHWSDVNRQFHLAVADIAGMRMLSRFSGQALNSWDRVRRFYFKTFATVRIKEAQADHRRMIKLLRERKAEQLGEVVAQHNRRAMALYQTLITDQQLPSDREF
jgi:DNA-binding GntR family transcriptional regulator